MSEVKVKIYLSQSYNPWFNLATEEWLFQRLDDVDHVLFLWRNQDSVVIGRSQNPWQECHLESMKRDDIMLARRQSGGGAVFHDIGNTNFTIVSKKSHYDRKQNFKIITRALANFYINAEVSGRNDIVVTDQEGQIKKVSGSAFKEKVDRALHHGSILLDADLDKLQTYLNPSKKKLAAKGVKSVKSRVMNLIELNPEISHTSLCDAIIVEFRLMHEADPLVEWLSPENSDHPNLKKYFKKMQNWDWLYGQTLEFNHEFDERFSWGTIDIQLLVKNAIIQDARVYSDSLYPDWIETIKKALIGSSYNPEAVTENIKHVVDKFPELAKETQELCNWLKTHIH